MPKKPRKERKTRQPISVELRQKFETGCYDMKTENGWEVFQLEGDEKKLQGAWEVVREEILPEWIEKHPGTRCWGWWQFDAPRWDRRFGAWFDGTLPEPRRRLGGIGTEDYEVLRHVPDFEFGIPTGWITKSQEDYYNGRVHKTHENFTPPPYKEGDFAGVAIDPTDPPQFESQAVFLDRHGLLSAAEKAHVAAHPELLEPEKIQFEMEEIENEKR